ncbi:hypothetical protein [Natrinema caseinilyticum]|uniref:hypothetical protein n=1 Tax=Natrinema caseinilyticum TaxID=2961570 RepID=UPI0020C2E245|nr:hypothetical protein [Natrinema caseinilyticum]
MTEYPRTLPRRRVLSGITGLGSLSVGVPSVGADGASKTSSTSGYTPNVERSRHPGHPRFVEVGERLTNPVFVGEVSGHDQGVYGSRDNLAPGATPTQSPENYDPADSRWSIADRPEGSTPR